MNEKTHNELREKVRAVYSEVPIKGVYYNSRGSMKFTYKGPENKLITTYLDPITSAVIINALVPKSGVIFRGGHGGGKTTLVEKVSHMLTGIPESEISSAMIRGNDDQNVNTLLATLKFGKLMAKGEEEVLWRKFVTSYVKIIDEVNRFPPPAQNALFEILNKGRVEFIDQIYEVQDFMAFATENPNDSGTYPLSKPFVDRFSFCVPAPQIPSASDQDLLASRLDDKLVGVSVKPIMKLDELRDARKLISSEIKMSAEAHIYAIYLTQAITTCERGDYFDKSHNEIPVGERCKGCAFDTPVAICKTTQQGISGRAFLDFQRWGKAYAWFLNAFTDSKKPEVPMEIIQTIAPYLMYHRVEPNEVALAKAPFYGKKLDFLEDVVKKTTDAYNTIKEALHEVPKVLKGELKPTDSKINEIDKDLVIKYHFKPLIEDADKADFRKIYEHIETTRITKEKIKELQRVLVFKAELKPPAQKYLLQKAIEKSEQGE